MTGLSGAVECKSPAHGVAECLYLTGVLQLVPALPYPEEGLLHHVLSLGWVQCDAQRQPVEPVFEWQHIFFEEDIQHCSLYR